MGYAAAGQFDRDGPRGRQCHVTRRKRSKLLGTVTDDHRRNGPGSCRIRYLLGDGRHGRCDGVQVGDLLDKPLESVVEHRQQSPGLAAPAAGENGNQRYLRRDAVTFPEPCAGAGLRSGFDGGMADIGAGQALGLEIRGFERQERQDMVEKSGDLLGPARRIGPNRRGDVVDERNPLSGNPLGDPKRESRRIDGDDSVRPEPADLRRGFPDAPQ